MKFAKLLAFCALSSLPSCHGMIDDARPSAAVVRVIVDSGTKTATDLGLENGLLFIFETTGILEQIWEIDASQDEYQCTGGYKYIYGVFNIFDENLRNRIKSVRNRTELLSMEIPASTQKQGAFICLLSVGSINLPVKLVAGESNTVCLTGKTSASKITVRKITNLLDTDTFPTGQSFRIRLDKASLHDISENIRLDYSSSGVICREPVYLEPDIIIEQGECSEEALSLYCFPSANCYLRLEGMCDFDTAASKPFRYNILIGKTNNGQEYILNNVSIYKAMECDDFETSYQYPSNISIQDWIPGNSFSFDDNAAVTDVGFTAELPERVGDVGHITFDDRAGRNRVNCSNGCIVVNGAGRYWELYAAKSGTCVITVSNTYHSSDITATVKAETK